MLLTERVSRSLLDFHYWPFFFLAILNFWGIRFRSLFYFESNVWYGALHFQQKGSLCRIFNVERILAVLSITAYFWSSKCKDSCTVITSHTRGNRICPVCLRVCVCWLTGTTFFTTTWVQRHFVHNQPLLCTIKPSCALWCTRGTQVERHRNTLVHLFKNKKVTPCIRVKYCLFMVEHGRWVNAYVFSLYKLLHMPHCISPKENAKIWQSNKGANQTC